MNRIDGKADVAKNISNILRRGGIGHKNVEAYGRQVVVTCYGDDSARRAAVLLQKASFIFRGITRSTDYNSDAARYTNTPNHHEVYRAFFRI